MQVENEVLDIQRCIVLLLFYLLPEVVNGITSMPQLAWTLLRRRDKGRLDEGCVWVWFVLLISRIYRFERAHGPLIRQRVAIVSSHKPICGATHLRAF